MNGIFLVFLDSNNFARGKNTRALSPESSMVIGDVVSVPSLAVDGHLGQTLQMDGPLSARCLLMVIENPWFVLDTGSRIYVTRIVIYFTDSAST